MIKPKALNKGDTIGIVAPSYYLCEMENYRRGIDRIRELGFNIKTGQTVNLKNRYMAGTDEQRAKDIMDMFVCSEVKAIICLIGGSSANRILDRLDYKVIAGNPKIFSGLSDITHLHLAFLARAGMLSLHHLDVIFGFGPEAGKAIDFGIDLFMKITTDPHPLGIIPQLGKWEVWRDGIAEGHLVGGNLTALCNLANTVYWPRFDDTILFWEAADTQIHEIDMLLTTLRLSGVFNQVKGMIIGKTPGCGEKEFSECAVSIRDIVMEMTEPYNMPIIAGVDFGHVDENIPLPLGLKARLNAAAAEIILLEGYVKR